MSADVLAAEFVAATALRDPVQAEMYALFSKYYACAAYSSFRLDLLEKDTVLLLRDAAGALQGFSTIKLFDEDFEGRRLSIMFSGDTVIARRFWGSQALAFNWIAYAGTIHRDLAGRALYWFLIVKGHRTYRYLPSFAVEFFPDWRRAEQPYLKRLADRLAAEKFAGDYKPDSGVIEFAQSRGQLAEPYAEASERERARDDVQYFLRRNPGFRQGHELVCLCELSPENLQPIARRVFERGLAP